MDQRVDWTTPLSMTPTCSTVHNNSITIQYNTIWYDTDDDSILILPTPIDDRFVDVLEEIDNELTMSQIITEKHLV